MGLKSLRKVALSAATAIMLLAACDTMDFGNSGGSIGFQSNYFAARSALEAGNYSAAAGRYSAMLSTAGPLESRLRLEMSHALLRADRYEEAASQARVVAAAHQDNRRAAALAVVGTAEHRLAQEAMSRGDFGAATVGHLQRAKAALDEMLAAAPELDPIDSMAQRRAMITASLANLGG